MFMEHDLSDILPFVWFHIHCVIVVFDEFTVDCIGVELNMTTDT